MSGQASSVGGCGLMEDVSHVLGAVVGDFDTDMRFICREGLTESFLLTLREPITRGAQEKPDLVEGITLAPAVAQCVLLDAAAYLTWGITGECDDVTGAWHAGCVRGAGQAMAFLLSLGGDPASRFAPPRGSLFRARPASSCTRCQTFPAPGPLKRAVGCSFPRVVLDASEFTRAPATSVLVVPHASHRPWVPARLRRRAGSSDAACRHGLIWDHTVFHVVPHWRARPEIVAPFDAQLSDRPADRPGPQTRPGCAHRVILLDEGRDLAGAFAAHPASYCATGSAPEPRPKGASITSTTTRP